MNENRRLTEIWSRTDGDDLISCVSAHMMASVQCATDMHEVRCFVPTYDGAHEPIRKSLISGADAEQANQKAQMAVAMLARTCMFQKKAHIFLQSMLQCHPASLLPLC